MTRVALAHSGDSRDPATWSGIPYGLARGLEAAGADVLRIDVRPRGTLRLVDRAVRKAIRTLPGLGAVTPQVIALRNATARRRLGEHATPDRLVQIGTHFRLPAIAALATFEDMTVMQALELDPGYRRMSARAADAWIERQREIYGEASACCVASAWAAAALTDRYGVPVEKVHAVGFGRNLTTRPLPRDWSAPRFLFVGFDWERKNGPGVIEAFSHLRREDSSARLDVVGGHPPLSADGVVGHGRLRIGVTDERRRLESLFESATCFVMPSRYEPFGIVYLEAAGAGVPSIGTSVGGAPDAIGLDTGRVVDPDDCDALLEAMRELADGDTARRLGEAAARRAEAFTWEAVARRVLSALNVEVDDA